MKNIKHISFIIIAIVLCFSFTNEVNASYKLPASDPNTCYSINSTTGAYKGSGTYDCIKKLNNTIVYCVEWKRAIKSPYLYDANSSWSTKSKNAILAGILIEKANGLGYSDVKEYATASAALNTFFSKYMGYAASNNYYSKNSVIMKLYDEAMEEYNTYKPTTTLPKITTSVSSNVLNYSSSAGNKMYVSNKITLSDLLTTYGGNSDAVTYTITTNKGAQICSKASGVASSCKSSVSITGVKSYNFYVKATDVNASDVIQVKIVGNNSSTYPSSILYTGANSTQKLLSKTSETYDRSTVSYLNFTVPSDHTIQILKVNEIGELLEGATLEIYQDDPVTGTKLASSNQTSSFTYTGTGDDFFNHDYYLVERSAPNGYILDSEVKKILEKSTNNNTTSSTICYHNGEAESDDSAVVDNERCNFENYQNKCQGSDGSIKDLTENSDCNFEPETPAEDTQPTPPAEDNQPTPPEEGTDNGEDNQENTTEESEITYEKVCYNINESKVVEDKTFCDNKNEYTKVDTSKGNIVVTQPNQKNVLSISKQDITNKKEVAGAKLKICTKEAYDLQKNDCEATTTIENIKMEWTSTTKAKEFSGIAKGSYYIVETLPPSGYGKVSTAVAFDVNEAGKIITNNNELKDSIIINNKLNSLTISKQDITTSKELPGATLSVCITYLDENNHIQLEKNQHTGDCIPAVLADGSTATWVSTEKPHVIEGLAAGNYYLVENIAPTDYSTAESILFTVSSDGTILDKNGKIVKDSKIVMSDERIYDPKTADLPIIVIMVVGLTSLIAGIICYRQSQMPQKIH